MADQPQTLLIKDLKRCGLLDETLVIWGVKFSRTPFCQGSLTQTDYGRDHHPCCFTMRFAGGGIELGIYYWETDDYGYIIVKDPMHV